ncbi:MAG: hypothetical protein L6Q98_04935 [Anaerolineae bacterium]|nr:hypothetical protein [Anaerolineae bacterium]NUQ05233.1 hypothetical protein [Anaerolineae bacterium]
MAIDPNLVYLALLAGMWLAVMAVYLPGTGVVELLAAGFSILALVALANMPTNWTAVVALVVGVVGFLIAPLLDRRLNLLVIVGLALQTLGALMLFNGVAVAPAVIGVTVAASVAYYQFVLKRSMAYQGLRPALIDDQPLIGAEGYVQRAINPVGAVYVRGESWTARAEEPIPVGAPVVVVDREELTLYVAVLKEKYRETEHVEEA